MRLKVKKLIYESTIIFLKAREKWSVDVKMQAITGRQLLLIIKFKVIPKPGDFCGNSSPFFIS